MRAFIGLSLGLLFVSACSPRGPSRARSPARGPGDELTASNSKTASVAGRVMVKGSWCEGTHPPGGYEPPMNPVPGQRMMVRRAVRVEPDNPTSIIEPRGEVIATFMTDNAGGYLVQLPPGLYCVQRPGDGACHGEWDLTRGSVEDRTIFWIADCPHDDPNSDIPAAGLH